MQWLSSAFNRSVDRLGLNDGVEDRRMKVVFHSLRHSCASQLAMAGANIQTIAAVLGHKSIAMAERYSHLSDQHLKTAVTGLDAVWENKTADVIQMPVR